jgi:diphthine-ammonia ligase
MKAFVSWSGGKDCMFALYRFISENRDCVHTLLNMCDETGKHSGSHGIASGLLALQAECMNIPLVQKPTSRQNYETNFKNAIVQLKHEGVNTGIFGDIYLDAHREWIERVCSDLQIQPVFPLWGRDTRQLLYDFIDVGFKAITVAVKADALPDSWRGRMLDQSFYNDITRLEGIDACAEQGEYHTFVFDGPLFQKPVEFSHGINTTENGHFHLQLNF